MTEEHDIIIAYCSYCHDPIYKDEKYIKKKKNSYYHEECWEQKTDSREELNFNK